MNPHHKINSRAGVTLIEMLVVVTIIALFAAIVGPRLLQHGDQARVVAAKEQIAAYQLALGQYKLDTGTFPTTDQGLQALRVQPQGVEQWHGPYLTKGSCERSLVAPLHLQISRRPRR